MHTPCTLTHSGLVADPPVGVGQCLQSSDSYKDLNSYPYAKAIVISTTVAIPLHLLGDKRDATWEDMSQYVVHFTSTPEVFAEILATGLLKASGPYGYSYFRKISELQSSHYSVCFSEVPINMIERLMRRRGFYGIAFTKEFMRSRDAARVWYVEQGSVQAQSLNAHLKDLVSKKDFGSSTWALTPFIDLLMPGKYEWDYEREWRHRGDLAFALEDVAFVITPEGVEELPQLAGLYAHPRHDLIVGASPAALRDYIESLVQRFSEVFENPVGLPVNGGDYVWIVSEWTTEDGVEDLFPELLESVREHLIEYLNGISPTWCLASELAGIFEWQED